MPQDGGQRMGSPLENRQRNSGNVRAAGRAGMATPS